MLLLEIEPRYLSLHKKHFSEWTISPPSGYRKMSSTDGKALPTF